MDLVQQINGLRDLKDNWNSYGAKAIPVETIEFAIAVASRLGDLGLTRADPTPEGAIWLSNDNESMWIHIGLDPDELTPG